MINSIYQSFVVFWLLVRRELLVLSNIWPTVVGSAFVHSSMMALSAGYFMPQMGMNAAMAVPLFLGSFLATGLSLGYACAIDLAYDLQSPRMVLYYYSLPVSFRAVLLGTFCSLMVRMLVVSVPVLIVGLLLINQWALFSISWPATVAMFLLSTGFSALLFLNLSYGCKLAFLLGNAWPRFLSPLFAFGCVFYTWRPIEQHSWYLSRLILCSPMTYCTEGLRSALLGGNEYLSSSICIMVLIFLNICLLMTLPWFIVSAINPVFARGK